MLRLSVLDQSVALSGRDQAASIRETLALAQACEALGYNRFWVSEHHNLPSIVGTAPEILMAAIAARTSRIRIGSAGIMLPHYSALKIAEQFRVLDALAPGRIDLGVGRAPGSDGRTAQALNAAGSARTNDFPEQVRDLMAWVNGEPLPEGHPFATIYAQPTSSTAPDVWMLGSSDYGAQVAAFFGLPYSYAAFITDGAGTEHALSTYRQLYRPSARYPQPVANICLWALVAETDEEAQRLFTSRARWRVGRDRGIFGPLTAPEDDPPYPFSPAAHAPVEALSRTSFVGTPSAVGARLRDLANKLGIEEIVVLTWSHDPVARQRSYELLAQEFALSTAQSA